MKATLKARLGESEGRQASATRSRLALRARPDSPVRNATDPNGVTWEIAHNPGWRISDDGNVIFDQPSPRHVHSVN
jgi:hypothetical protein